MSVLAGGTQTDIVGPTGSGQFGYSVTILPNGNIVVTDPGFDLPGPIQDVGAVHLYDGATLDLISTLTGSTAVDLVGYGGITILANGNFVVRSYLWDNGAATQAGAVTWIDANVGLNGEVSAANSLVGSTSFDQVGIYGVTPLNNGNYVVRSTEWDNSAITDAGAVTWGDGTIGTSGPVSASNSLVGSTGNDQVGRSGVTALTNGNFVVASDWWNNGSATDAGAATWGDGTTGISGSISASNSLVGSTAYDRVGSNGVIALTNGNYVVASSQWDNGAVANVGAATWGDGTTGIAGTVSVSNSLVGSSSGDAVGKSGVTALTNGNYVVLSDWWNNGAATDAGAATWGDGTTGISGTVSASNSLVGSTASDNIGNYSSVTALTNGDYVVRSIYWDNVAATDAGAVTWGDGTTGISGPVSASNSLVGSTANDNVGNGGVTELTNGNYVVTSYYWNNGAATDAGAVTWGSGNSGISGTVSAANSLVGSAASDNIGYYSGNYGVTALANGNYVVASNNWNNGAVTDVGAVTWGDGTTGISGPVSAANSLVGSTANDQVGRSGATALTNGNYVVSSSLWNNGSVTDAGAATWGDGTSGISGPVSASNSLVGSTANDYVGGLVTALMNGNYVVTSSGWNNGAATSAGAITWGNGNTGISGPVSASNSLVGSTANDSIGSGATSVTALTNGNYVIRVYYWDNGATTDAGAVTWGNGAIGISGPIDSNNSVLGNVANQGTTLTFSTSSTGSRIVVGKRAENVVAVFDPLAPTSAGVDVSGRVATEEGIGIGRARVSMTDGRGNTRYALTNPFGYYRFEDVPSGESYILSVEARRYQFESRLIQVDDALTGVDFVPVNRSGPLHK